MFSLCISNRELKGARSAMAMDARSATSGISNRELKDVHAVVRDAALQDGISNRELKATSFLKNSRCSSGFQASQIEN